MIRILLGPRRSGRTFTAIDRARKSGRPFVVVCPNQESAAGLARVHPGIETLSFATPEHAKRGALKWEIVIIDDAQEFERNTIINLLGGTLDWGSDVALIANAEDSRYQEWIRTLLDSGKYEIEEMKPAPNETVSEKFSEMIARLSGERP